MHANYILYYKSYTHIQALFSSLGICHFGECLTNILVVSLKNEATKKASFSLKVGRFPQRSNSGFLWPKLYTPELVSVKAISSLVYLAKDSKLLL